MKNLFPIVTTLALASALFAADPVEVWHVTYNAGYDDAAWGIAIDSNSGFLYVAGNSYNGVNYDTRLVKYRPDGDVAWSKTFDGGDDDEARDVAVDGEGYVYIAGYSYNGTDDDFLIIKYTPDGDTVWTRVSDASLVGQDWDDEALGIAVDDSYVYVTGYNENTITGNDAIRTLIYDKDNNFFYTRGFDTPEDDGASDITVDPAGNSYVVGYSGHDYRIIKYDNELNELWSKTSDAGDLDRAMAVALGTDGFIYVTGSSGDMIEANFYTVRYSSDGTKGWSHLYDSGDPDMAIGMAVDEKSVYVTGWYIDTLDTIWDCRTLAYDKQGDIQWNITFDLNPFDAGADIAVDDSGYIYVTGITGDWGGNNMDMLTIKYRQVSALEEQPTPESPLFLEVLAARGSSVTLRYLIPVSTSGTLAFYSVDGRMVESARVSSGESRFTWDTHDVPSGVYFARLEARNTSISEKVLVVR